MPKPPRKREGVKVWGIPACNTSWPCLCRLGKHSYYILRGGLTVEAMFHVFSLVLHSSDLYDYSIRPATTYQGPLNRFTRTGMSRRDCGFGYRGKQGKELYNVDGI
jgi:hypothetical protein